MVLDMVAQFPAQQLLAFMAGALVLNLTPGQDVFFASACGIQNGPRAGALAGLGVGFGSGIAWVLAALVVGGGAGAFMAHKVEMTKMPELVAFMHSMIGLAAVFIAIAATAAIIEMTREDVSVPAPSASSLRPPTDPLRHGQRRCQQMGEAAAGDAECLRTWAETRDRFLGRMPAPQATAVPGAGSPHCGRP